MKRTLQETDPSCSTNNGSTFRCDVIKGLSAGEKYLEAKYFYDAAGDELFRQIMQSPEYYPTRAERTILSQQSNRILDVCSRMHHDLDVVELGAGDASKSVYLLQAAIEQGLSNHYYPIDISPHVIRYLQLQLPGQLPGLHVHGRAGEYFDMLEHLPREGHKARLVLFLGGTIGNMPPEDATRFCRDLHTYLQEGDLVLTGFDLKKDPAMILAAYNDAAGITREFNLNLLRRINRELGGNFRTDQFSHYPVYDPGTGACKSYLISSQQQVVSLDDGHVFHFEKHEAVFMEVSQKYTLPGIEQMALQAGFEPLACFPDPDMLFADVLWKVPSLKKVLTQPA